MHIRTEITDVVLDRKRFQRCTVHVSTMGVHDDMVRDVDRAPFKVVVNVSISLSFASLLSYAIKLTGTRTITCLRSMPSFHVESLAKGSTSFNMANVLEEITLPVTRFQS